jgi:hypothetical protein
LILRPENRTLPRVRPKESAIEFEFEDATLSDSEFDLLLASTFRQRSAGLAEEMIRPDSERGTKPNSAVGKIEKETQHEDEP